jgi:hypothetical protein
MKLTQLNEAIKQYTIDDTIASLRSNHYFFVQNGLRGSSEFENGKCFEFAMALYNYLKTKGEQPELIFLVGNMKKSEAAWYDTTEFDPTQEHPFHTIVQVRKFYYDINGKLGNKREIATMWPKFRNKKMVVATVDEVKSYVKDNKLVDSIISTFQEFKTR